MEITQQCEEITDGTNNKLKEILQHNFISINELNGQQDNQVCEYLTQRNNMTNKNNIQVDTTQTIVSKIEDEELSTLTSEGTNVFEEKPVDTDESPSKDKQNHTENEEQNHIENEEQNHIETEEQNHTETEEQNHTETEEQNRIETEEPIKKKRKYKPKK